MAKNLPALKATTPMKRAKANKYAVVRYAMDILLKVGLLSVCCSSFIDKMANV